MSKKSKIVIARIMTMLMVLSVLPFDLFTTAGVVMAQESAEVDLALDNDMGETDVDNIVDIGGPESIGGIQETEPEENGSEETNTPAVSEGESVEGGTQESGKPVAASAEDEGKAEDEAAADDANNNEETAEPSESDGADVSNAEESEVKTYVLDPETEEKYTSPKENGEKKVGTDGYFSLIYKSDKGVSIATFADITTNIKDKKGNLVEENKKCYDPLLWGTYANDTLGTKATADRTKCVRLVGGKMDVGQNCIKIKTTLPNAKLTVYSSPKAAYENASAKIEVKQLSGGKFGNAVCSGADTVNPNVAKDVLTLAEAGEYYIGFSSGGGIILYMEVTEGGSSQGGDNGDTGDDSTSTIDLDETTKSIVSAVELGTAAAFSYADGTEGTPSEIVFKAEKLTENDTKITAAIKTAVTTAVGTDKAETSYYDLTLAEKGTDKAVTLTAGTVKFKMPYPTGVTNKNRITVLHEDKTLASNKVKKETDGFVVEADGFSPYTVIIKEAPVAGEGKVLFTDEAGYEEGAYAEWEPYDGADGYKAYYSTSATGTFTPLDNELIRQYKDYWRADVVGLKKGTYYIKVEAYEVTGTAADGKKELNLLGEAVTGALTVTNYDRSGYAFSSTSQSVAGVSSFGTGSGAYNDDGTLRSGAQVIYVTKDTAKTCKAMLHTGGAGKAPVEVTGLQAILDAKQKAGTEKDILDIRIIGCVTRANLDSISSSAEGIQIKGKAKYNEMNITLEGIGEDAVVKDFGFLIRNCCNVEFRNFAIMAFMDDGVSLDTANKNIWVHDLDIFYGATGGDSDQAKGDGSFDVKAKSTFITASYNHFWDSGKCSLCGMSDTEEFTVTYHHNWFDHSDSRHPRIRVGSIHVYNNYFDGNSKYGVGVTKGSSAFVEANYFRNCKYPMLISQQASDMSDGKGTFSGEDGGIIKAYNNTVVGAKALVYANAANGSTAANPTAFDAYLASDRSDTVPGTYKTVKGGTSYNNFDTKYDLGVDAANINAPGDVPSIVMSKAGRLNGGDFSRDGYSALNGSAADESYSVDSALKSAVVNYKTSVVSIGGIDGVKTSSGGNQGGTGDNGDPDNPGDNGDPDNPDNPNPPPVNAGIYVHNFTTDGYGSDDFFAISANKQSSPTSFTYTDVNGNSLTLNKAIKMESSTSISFTAQGAGTLKIVTKPDSSARTKIDGNNNTPVDGVIEQYLEAGKHTITKGDKEDIYYIVFIMDGYDADDVSAPIASMASGDVPKGTSITLQCATEGAKIYYTTDGTEPNASSNLYTGTAISLGDEEKTVVIKAIAIKGEGDDASESTVVTYTYKVADIDPNAFVSTPVANKESGTVEKGTAVELTTSTDGAEIYYTTDGTEPSASNGTKYTTPIVINETTTVKAIAVKGENESDVSEYTYTVSGGGDVSLGNKTFEFNPEKIGFTLTAEDPAAATIKMSYIMPDTGNYGTDNYFTIGNKEKKSKVSPSEAVLPADNKSGITNYTLRYQFGGSAGKTDAKAIKFNTYGESTVYIGAYAADNDATRQLLLDDYTPKQLSKTPGEYVYNNVPKGNHVIWANKDYYILYVIVEDTNVPGTGTENPNPPAEKTYTIKIDKADGTTPETQTKKAGEVITLADAVPASGYTFKGWSLNGGTTTFKDSYTVKAEDAKDGVITITAVYEAVAVTYTVTFDAGEGTLPEGMQATVTATADQEITLGDCIPPTGKKFMGWQKDGSTGTPIKSTYTVHAEDADEDGNIKFKAVYAPENAKFFKVTLDTDHGTLVNGGESEIEVEENGLIDPGACEKAGYIFNGWMVDGKIVGMPYEVTKDVTLKAVYEEITYSIVYQVGNGTAPAGLPTSAKTEDTIKIANAEPPAGYTFIGWLVNGEEVLKVYNVKAEDAKDGIITFTAVYEAITYTVKFDADGGTLPSGMQAEVTAKTGESLTLGDCTAPTGQKFIGWMLNGNEEAIVKSTYEVNAADAVTDNTITLKALYAPEGDTTVYYTVTLDTDGGTLVSGGGLVKTFKENEEIDPGECEKAGYKFIGWTLNGEEIKLPYTVTGDVTLKAKYKEGPSHKGIAIVGLEKEYEFTGAKIIPNIAVVDYDIEDVNGIDGCKVLCLGVDYTVRYANNNKLTSVSNKVSTVTVTGKGNYAGKDTSATFKIIAPKDTEATLADLKGAKLDKIASVEYNGDEQHPDIKLKLKGEAEFKTYKYVDGGYKLNGTGEAIGAKVSLSNNINKGTATILLTGKKGTNGKETSVKKTFKITPIDISKGLTVDATAGTYAVKGAKLESITVKYGDKTLRSGLDYTVKYSANKKAGEKGSIVITGKGNYTKKFTAAPNNNIKQLDLTGTANNNPIKAIQAYAGIKAGKVKATVVDNDGNTLKPAQYTLKVYTKKDDVYTECPATDKLEAKDTIYVEAVAKDTTNLTGTTAKAEFIVGSNIAQAKFVLNKVNGKAFTAQYTGAEIKLKATDLTVTIKEKGSTKTLKMGTDYEIVSYSNNINKGTATAVIKGINDYSGTKTVKFKIVGKKMAIGEKNIAWNDITSQFKNFMDGIFN